MKTVFTNTKMNVKMGWMCKLSLVSVSHIRLITYIVKYGTGSDPKNSIIKVIIECKNYDEFDIRHCQTLSLTIKHFNQH